MGTKANSVQVAPLGKQYLQLHARAFRRSLLRWFRRHGRDLPWRRTRDPYHIMVSEFMLQQTQVMRVEGYYHRFLARYPTVEALASASPAMVRESWEGLGYYRRAANLHRLAQEVVREQRGVIPADPAVLRRAPGHRPIHRRGRRELCLRAEVTRNRHQCRPGAPPGVPSAARSRAWLDELWATGGDAPAAEAAGKPGRSIRQSWSWARWSAPPGWPMRDCPVRAYVSDGCPGYGEYYLTIAPPTAPPGRAVPAIEATIRCRARSSSK